MKPLWEDIIVISALLFGSGALLELVWILFLISLRGGVVLMEVPWIAAFEAVMTIGLIMLEGVAVRIMLRRVFKRE